MVLICIPLIIRDVEPLFMGLLAILLSSLELYLFKILIVLGFFSFFMWRSSLCILDIILFHFDMSHPCLNIFLLFERIRYFRCATCPSPALESAISLRSLDSFWWKMAFRNRCRCEVYPLLLGGCCPQGLSGGRARESVCMYIYLFLHLYIENHEPVTSIPQFSIHHHRTHSSFFPFHNCNFPFKQ